MSSNTDHALAGVLTEHLDHVRESMSKIVADNQTAMKIMASQTGPSAVYETVALALNLAYPVPLLGYDLSRKRALITLGGNNVNGDTISIGHLSQIAGGVGFPLSELWGTSFEVFTTDEVYVVWNSAAPQADANVTVYAWVEKTVN